MTQERNNVSLAMNMAQKQNINDDDDDDDWQQMTVSPSVQTYVCVPSSHCILASKHALQLLWDCTVDPLHSLLKPLSMHLYGLMHFLLCKTT